MKLNPKTGLYKIPVRSQLRAAKDKLLLAVDLSQAEAWVVAFLANEPVMKLELLHGDIHTRTARTVLDIPSRPLLETERYTGKKCNHAFNYLMGPDRACEVINAEGQITVTNKETKVYRKKYLELYRIEPWWLEVEAQLRETHTLVTPYGFKRKFYNSGKELIKEGVAFIPQSTIADHMYGRTQPGGIPGGLKVVDERIIGPSRGELKIVHSAHDSAIIEYPASLDVQELYGCVREIIRRPMIVKGEEFTIPCDAKWGDRWEDFDKLKEVA